MYRSRIPMAVLLGALIAFAQDDRAFAESPTVTAVLSNSEAVVGQMVELQIKVTGAGNAQPPENISIDGLEIHATGTSRQFEMRNFTTTSSVTYNYAILPLKAGQFTIPSQTILVGGKSLRTPELTLNVADSPGRSSASRPAQNARPGNASKLVFAELIVPKKTAFVGEIVPVQIRLGFDPRTHPRLIDLPEITGQGFTAHKLQQSGENRETISGRTYDVVTFKTAIAAARAGNFEIGPVKAKAQVLTPRRPSSPRSRSPFLPCYGRSSTRRGQSAARARARRRSRRSSPRCSSRRISSTALVRSAIRSSRSTCTTPQQSHGTVPGSPPDAARAP